jgi:GAF domain-containing protein
MDRNTYSGRFTNKAFQMNMIDFPCPSCTRILKISAAHIGKSGTCNHCGGQILVSSDAYQHAENDYEARSLEALARNPNSFGELIDGVYSFLTAFLVCDFQGKAVLFLMDDEAGGLRLAETRGQFSEEFMLEESFVPLGTCLCGRAAQSGQVLVCGDCFDDPRHDHKWLGMQMHGHYVIPLTHAGRVRGVLTLYTRAGVQADSRRMALLEKVREHAGNGLQRLLQTQS